jgi:iron complex outermembrane receptor protein
MSRPSRPLALLIALATSLLLPDLLDAQAGTVRGTVTDQAGGPVSGVSLVLEGTGLGTTTLAQGTYEFRGIASGSYTLRTRRVGFKPMSARVTVTAGGVVEQDFRLTPSPIQLAPIDVTVGSRAQHTAAEELAVPVDVYTAEVIARQGTTETSQILQALAPSVNFPRQTVTDATDIVRPFTLRGLSPDHSLVLVNGWRRHQTALVNTYAYGMAAGSSGVDLNALPASAIDRIEVLRDGASAQYGSDAIAGVINVVTKEGYFSPFLNADFGRYTTDAYPAWESASAADRSASSPNSGTATRRTGRGLIRATRSWMMTVTSWTTRGT